MNYMNELVLREERVPLTRELLEASPRPGGYIRHSTLNGSLDLSASRGQSTGCQPCGGSDDSKVTKELFKQRSQVSNASSVYRVQPTSFDKSSTTSKTMNMPMTRFDEETTEDWEVDIYDDINQSKYALITVAEDNINMVSVTISLVMLMASEVVRIPEEYFVWAENFLGCIKDDGGNTPPNVQGILDLIQKRQIEATEKKKSTTSLKKSKVPRPKQSSSQYLRRRNDNVMTVEKLTAKKQQELNLLQPPRKK